MSFRSRRALRIAASACVAAVIAGTVGATSSTAKAAGSQFVVGVPVDSQSFDPANALSFPTDALVIANTYDRLVTLKTTGTTGDAIHFSGLGVSPDLASSWTVKGATITFHLRKAEFASGDPVTAEDVKWSFDRNIPIDANGKNQAAVGGINKANQIKVINPSTVAITFENSAGKPTALSASLPDLRFIQLSIIDSKLAKKHATPSDPYASKWLATHIAGSGPYTLQSHQVGQQIVLQTNPHYWGPTPAYKSVVLKITGSSDPVSLMKTGVVDYLADGVTTTQFDNLKSSGFTVINEKDVPDEIRALVTADSGSTKNPLVRQAIAYATPYSQIINTVFAGRAEKLGTILNPADPFGTKAWAKYATNIPKAKSLLAKAGETHPSVKIWYQADISYLDGIAQLMKQSLGSAGITAVLRPTPAAALGAMYEDRVKGKNNGMTGIYLQEDTVWLDDPNTLMREITEPDGTGNWARYINPTIAKLQSEYGFATNTPARKAAYAKIQTALADSAVVFPIMVTGVNVALAPHISGVLVGPDGFLRFQYLKPAT